MDKQLDLSVERSIDIDNVWRDASGTFCNVGGQLVPMDEPLREVGTDLVPLHTPTPQTEPNSQRRSPTPPPSPLPHTVHPSEAPKSQPEDERRVPSPKRGGLGRGLAPKGDGGQKENPELSIRKEVPKEETQVSSLNHAPIPPDAAIPIERKRTLGESATQFAQGFGKGVRDETAHMYRDVTELPHRVATTGRELLEDIQAGRKLRALAPIEALAHAIQNASREDVQRLAHAVVDGAIDFYNKSPQEKGEALGKATVSVASDVAIAALTEGLGSVAALRKAEKALEAADHVRDAERAVKAIDRGEDAARAAQKAKQTAQVSETQRSRMLGESGTRVPSKTVWKQDGARIDVENPNPGRRPGQIHFQQGKDKYLYDPELGEFVDAPRSVNKRLEDARFRQGLDKAMKILGEDK